MIKFFGIGRLTRDCEIKTTKSGKTVCTFSVACKDNFAKERTHFYDCVSFGEQGITIDKWFKKGSRIELFGYVKQETWENKEGKNQSKIVLHVDKFEFVDSKKESGSTAESVANKFNGEVVDNAPSFNDDDIPF